MKIKKIIKIHHNPIISIIDIIQIINIFTKINIINICIIIIKNIIIHNEKGLQMKTF